MQGKIIKGIAGFYYVHTGDTGVYECKAKGIFRNRKQKPLVGDNVVIDVISDEERIGNIIELLPRKNELIRPAVANIDKALIVFASVSPAPNFSLLSKFLVMMSQNNIETTICFNKIDQTDDAGIARLEEMFKDCGCEVIFTSASLLQGLDRLKKFLVGNTTAFAGPSGVGKSSILNAIFPDANTETGEISEKINRGKHTTRHTEIFNVDKDTYIMDTPGFTSLDFFDIEAEDLRLYFNEFELYEGNCRFNGCVHINEPDCAVKAAVEKGLINNTRYAIYNELYTELKNKRKY